MSAWESEEKPALRITHACRPLARRFQPAIAGMSSSRASEKVDIIIEPASEQADQPAGTDPTSGLLRARGAAARAQSTPAGPASPADDADDEAPDDSQSPLFVWLSMLARTLLSALHTAFSAVLFALYPIYILVPSFVLEGLFRLVRKQRSKHTVPGSPPWLSAAHSFRPASSVSPHRQVFRIGYLVRSHAH